MSMQDIDPTTKETYADGVRKVLMRWQRPDYIRLHAGEMTAQEMRSVLAVLKAVSLEVHAYMPPPQS
jgi:hypothetical protein